MLKVISFDVEGTLITHQFSKIVWEEAIPKLYSEKTGISQDEAGSYIKREYNKVSEAQIEWYDIKYWFNHFGLIDYEKILNRYKNEVVYFAEVKQVLKELNKKYLLIINSNSANEFLNFEVEKIKRYFHRIFSSPTDFRQTKKKSNVYLKICNILKVRPTEIVHVGDRWNDDYIVPRKIGITAFFLDREGKKKGKFVVKDLNEFKIKVAMLKDENNSPSSTH